jgi:hypothetical protein
VLTVNGIKLYLQRETDWEAGTEANNRHTGRKATIVYAGLKDLVTYWGKKI